MNTLTNNTNLLSQVGFKLVINSKDFSNVEFFAISATIPSVALAEVSSPMRNEAGFVPGEKLNYESFNIRLAIDEDMTAYKEIFNWMYANTKQADIKIADMTLFVLSSHNNPNLSFTFKNAFPTNLGSFELTAQASDVEYISTDVTFRYDYFVIGDVNAGLNC